MNISTRTRIAGATATLGVLLALTACGSETVVDPGTQPLAKPQVKGGGGREQAHQGGYGTTADSAERRAAEEKARQDRASTARWYRVAHVENQLKHAGHPGQP
jgi:hypothetical protein